MSNTTDLTAEERADQFAADIERFAAFVRANPDVAEGMNYSARFLLCLVHKNDPKAQMAEFARRGLRGGATVLKDVSDKFAGADLHFGGVLLHVYAERHQVCERVVVASREEVIEEPDPDLLAKATASVPTVKRTEVVEDVEWVCSPILAAAGDIAARDEQPAGVA